MDELIAKHLTGVATDIEARTLDRWRRESSENEHKYRQMRGLWELSEEADAPVAAPPAEVISRIIAIAEERRRRAQSRAGRRAALRSPWLAYALATAAVATLVVVWFGRSVPDAGPLLTPVESNASQDDVVTLSLSDGSLVRLAGSSTIEFPPLPERRDVVLDGRAFFAVAPGDTPFVVQTAVSDLTVVGTRFEVAASDEDLRLIVVEGVVTLGGAGGIVEVLAGQVAYVEKGESARVVRGEDIWSLLDWVDGLLIFQSTPLVQVADELQRTFGIDVRVAPELADRRITAWFSDEPVDEVLSAVCLVAGAACESGAGSFSIGSGPEGR